MSVRHTDAATIAQWKDSLNDAWADLGELIDTRNQMLEASRELHKYFHDCKDVLSRIWKNKTPCLMSLEEMGHQFLCSKNTPKFPSRSFNSTVPG